MSGTSLDGLDIALCNFEKSEGKNWIYKIIHA
jgi:1,6-anhydro-N-acetylmuramate kinase